MISPETRCSDRERREKEAHLHDTASLQTVLI